MEHENIRLFISALAAAALACLLFIFTGCGHNQSALISGKAFIFGGQGVQYYNGTILLDNSRENSSWKVEVDDDDAISGRGNTDSEAATADVGTEQGDGRNGKFKGVKSIERRIDKQITGYLVEVAKHNPEAVMEYLENVEDKKD